MDKKKLIEDLIGQVKQLSFEDMAGFDKFRTRAIMILDNIYGDRAGYSAQILNIDLYPPYQLNSYAEHRAYWEEGKQKIQNLLETIHEEMELFPDREAKMARQLEKASIGHGHGREMEKAQKPDRESLTMKEKREQFLVKLNEMSEGNINKSIETMKIGKTLDFDRATTFNYARYFAEKGFIKPRDEADGTISITAEGIDEADKVQSRTTAPSFDQEDLAEEMYFSAGRHLDIQKYLARVLRQATNSLWICDSYMDEKIVEEISSIQALEIRLLTTQPKGLFKQRLAAAKEQFPERKIEAKIYDKCHDRFYIINQLQVWTLGASLNKAGKGATLLSKVKNEIEKEKILHDFIEWWVLATEIKK